MRLAEEDARERLARERVARLATTGGDGQPHLVPVTFAVDGDRICVAVDHKPKTTANLRRLRNIRENPLVSVLADHYEEDWTRLWWVRADGRATVIENERSGRLLDALVAKYGQYQQVRPAGPVILIEITRLTGWTGGPATAFPASLLPGRQRSRHRVRPAYRRQRQRRRHRARPGDSVHVIAAVRGARRSAGAVFGFVGVAGGAHAGLIAGAGARAGGRR